MKKVRFSNSLLSTLLLAAFAFGQTPPQKSATTAQSQAKSSSDAECPAPVPSSSAGVAVREIDATQLGKLIRHTAGAQQAAGRPVLINFWATWCETCREEFPDLVKIGGEFGARGLDFFLVSLDDPAEIKTGVSKFLQEQRATSIPAFLLNTPDQDAAIALVDPKWSGALPATFLFDRSGQIVFKQIGRVKPDELREALKKVTSDK